MMGSNTRLTSEPSCLCQSTQKPTIPKNVNHTRIVTMGVLVTDISATVE